MVYLRETPEETALVHVARAAHDPVVLDARRLTGVETARTCLRSGARDQAKRDCHLAPDQPRRPRVDVAHTVTRHGTQRRRRRCSMKARLSRHRQARRRQRGDGQPSPQRQARGGRGDAAGGAHLARRPRLRPAEPAAPQERRAGRSGHPGADQPDLPGVRPGDRDRAGPHGFTPVLCTQTPGGVHEDDYVQMLLDRGVAGIIYVSGQHADTTTDPDRYVHLRDRGLPIVLVNGYMRGRRRPVHLQRRRRLDGAVARATWCSSGTPAIGLAVGPDRYVPVIRKIAGLPPRPWSTLLGRDDVEDLIERTMFTVEGGARRRRPADRQGCTAVVCGSDLMALGAIRARPPARPAGARATSRWSATTTRPSSPSPTRR